MSHLKTDPVRRQVSSLEHRSEEERSSCRTLYGGKVSGCMYVRPPHHHPASRRELLLVGLDWRGGQSAILIAFGPQLTLGFIHGSIPLTGDSDSSNTGSVMSGLPHEKQRGKKQRKKFAHRARVFLGRLGLVSRIRSLPRPTSRTARNNLDYGA